MYATARLKLWKLYRALQRGGYRRGLLRGVAAAVEHEQPLRRLAPATILDVGANRGQFALVLRRLFPNSEVFCFEPLEGPADRLASLFRSDTLVTVLRYALGSRSERRPIYVSRRDDSSSLLRPTERQVAVFPGTDTVASHEVDVVRLDSIFRTEELVEPILLKIDAQGFELEILRGCGALLHRIDAIYVESSFTEFYEGQSLANSVLQFLLNEGFQPVGVYNPVVDRVGSVLQADWLFVRPRGQIGDSRLAVGTH